MQKTNYLQCAGGNGMKFLMVKDLQEILHIGRDKAYALMHSKAFPAIKIGGRYFVAQDQLQKWIENYSYKTFEV